MSRRRAEAGSSEMASGWLAKRRCGNGGCCIATTDGERSPPNWRRKSNSAGGARAPPEESEVTVRWPGGRATSGHIKPGEREVVLRFLASETK